MGGGGAAHLSSEEVMGGDEDIKEESDIPVTSEASEVPES